MSRGIYNEKMEVAVKIMKDGTMSEVDFIDEAKVMMLVISYVLLLSSFIGENPMSDRSKIHEHSLKINDWYAEKFQ